MKNELNKDNIRAVLRELGFANPTEEEINRFAEQMAGEKVQPSEKVRNAGDEPAGKKKKPE